MPNLGAVCQKDVQGGEFQTASFGECSGSFDFFVIWPVATAICSLSMALERHIRGALHGKAERTSVAPPLTPGVPAQKKQRDRLIRLAEAHSDWALGFADEVWWSRVAQPNLHSWAGAHHELRLNEKTIATTDPDPKALACYGLLLPASNPAATQLWLRFAAGQPVSDLTIQFLTWCCDQLAAQGKHVLLLIWDNASWHKSAAVRHWRSAHNQHVKRDGVGVRVIICLLPTKSPWLNPIEPRWVHGKRAVLEPERVLSADELEARVYAYYHCPPEPKLRISEKVT